jgi:hypothetical protein
VPDKLYIADLARTRNLSARTISAYLSAARTGNRRNVSDPPPPAEPELERMPGGGYRRWWDASRTDVQEWINRASKEQG